MLSRAELRQIAVARLKDARVLLKGRRFDGAVYLCGYAVELALKARICKTIRAIEYPERIQGLKTHDLAILLQVSGIEPRIRTKLVIEWSVVSTWSPEVRYRPVGMVSLQDAQIMIQATSRLLRATRL